MASTGELTEFYGDIITGAIEGGIGYWSQCSQYQVIAAEGGCRAVVGGLEVGGPQATIYEFDEDAEAYSGEPMKITDMTIAKAFGILRNAELKPSGDYDSGEVLFNSKTGERIFLADRHRKRMMQAYREKDAGNLDSDDCDNIVQLGLFGVCKYG